MAKILWALPLNGPEKCSKQFFLAAVCVSAQNRKEIDFYSCLSKPRKDDLTLKGKQDDIRINISQPWERQYWSKKLGISQQELRKRVKERGPLVKKVMEKKKGER